MLAEEFRNYADNDGKTLFGKELSKQTIFQKMWNAIKEFFGIFPDIQQYYSKLYKGDINHIPSLSNALFGKLNKSFTANEITIGSVEVNNFINAIDSIIVEGLEKKGKSHILFTSSKEAKAKNLEILLRTAKNVIKAKLDEKSLSPESQEKLKFLYDNFNGDFGFEQTYKKNSMLFSDIKSEEIHKTEDELENTPNSVDETTSSDEGAISRDNMVEYGEKNKKSAIKQASNEIIYLMSTLSSGELDKYGFPKLLPLTTTWYRLSEVTRGITNPKEMYAKIDALGEKHSEYKQLLKRLPSLEKEILDVREIALLQSFIQAFSKPKTELFEGVLSYKDRILNFYNSKAATKSVNKLQKQFAASFKTQELADNEYIVKNVLGENMLNVSKIKKDFGNTLKKNKQLEFLKAIGINLSDETINSKAFKDLQNDVEKDRIGLLYDSLINKLGSQDFAITDPLAALRGSRDLQKNFKYNGEANTLDAILQTEIDATSEFEEDMAMLPSGDMKSQISQFSKTSFIYSQINNREAYPTLQDFVKAFPEYSPESSPMMKYTLWMNSLFQIRDSEGKEITGTNYGKRRNSTISLRDVGGLKTKSDREDLGEKTTDLFVLDKIFYDLNSFMFNNVVEHMRYGDKGSSYGTDVKYFSTNSAYPVLPTSFQGKLLPKQALEIFQDYFQGIVEEIKQHEYIQKIKAETGIGIAKYDKNGASFRMFEHILPKELQEEIRTKIKEGKGVNDIPLREHLEKFFTKEIAKLKKELAKSTISKEAVFNKSILNYDEILNAFVVNNYIYNFEQMAFINGDVAQFKNAEDIHKRLSADSATGDFSVMNEFVKKFLNNTGRTQEFELTGHKSDVTDVYKSVVLNDSEFASSYLENYLQTVLNNLGSEQLASELMKIDDLKEAKSLLEAELKEKSFNAYNVLKAFKEVNETDALGLCTLDFYRNFKVAIGQWNDLAEKAYEKVAKGESLNEDEMYYFVPIKAQYSGTIANTKEHFQKDVRIDAFDKFALIPMLPEAIKGKPLEQFNNKLVKQNIGYAVYQSGSKKAALQKDGNFENFDNETYFTNDKYFKYLKEQVYIEPKIKSAIIFATQFNKLFNVDLFANGEPKSPKIGNLAKKYNGIRKKLVDIEKEIVKRDLGIKKDGDVIDFTKLAKLLKDEFQTRDLPDNIQDFIRTDSKGQLVFSLDSSLSRQKVVGIILSIVNNRLVKGKMNGDNYIQTAFTGWKTDDSLKLYELKNGKVSKMQAKVSIGKFKPLLKLVDAIDEGEALKALNKLLKDENWVKEHEDLLTMVGVRIPVQGANSMLNIIVEEFLPETSGSLIVLPSEITSIAGSDFDIDKVSMYTPNFNDDGTLAKRDSGEITKKTDQTLQKFPSFLREGVKQKVLDSYNKKDRDKNINNFLKKEYEELSSLENKRNKQKIYDQLKSFLSSENALQSILDEFPSTSVKAALQNEMISILSETMSQPEMFESLFTPNSTAILQPLSEKIREMVGNNEKVNYSTVYSYITQINQFTANLVGKKSLGIGAKANTFSQLFKQHNVYLNNEYNTGEVNKDGSPIFKKVNIYLKHNKTPDGANASLAGEYDANGQYKISEIISQFINGFVDVAKDPWVFDLGATFEAVPTMLYLNHLGVPIEDNVYLMNQPIIKDYLATKKLKNFQTGKLLNSFYKYLSDKKIVDFIKNKYRGENKEFSIPELFTKEDLLKNIYNLENPENISIFNAKQKAILNHYLELEEQASNLREMTSALDFDTSRISSIFSAFEKEQLYKDVLEKKYV